MADWRGRDDGASSARWRAVLLLGCLGMGLSGLMGASAVGMAYYRHVVAEPGDHLSPEHLRAVIAQESPVYYRDGVTRIGVFFDTEHRQYVGPDELPLEWMVAIVAAEDARFWTHPGVDWRGLLRAVRDNLSAGRVVAGGSTLTQQTAKNLFYRPDRSLRSKGVELVNALRLEAHYDKRAILTFYANQFHVTGNGRGLAIAARHFFDREVEDLGLAEAAFLAGAVKGPNRYDPFVGDAERRAAATARAHERTRYVLRRIVEVPAEQLAGPLDVSAVRAVQADARRLLEEGFELSFERGTFRYESSAVLDEVARRLAEPPFAQALAAAGVDDPATAGLVVITTLDADVQRGATYALWHHLTEVGSWLEGLGPEDFVHPGHHGPVWQPDLPLRPGEFLWARVRSRVEEPRKHLLVDLGGRACVVDRDAVVRVAVASYRGRTKDRHAKAPTAVVDAFVDAIPDGSVVLVSVREVPEDGPAVCDLEVRPELQGALMVVEGGQIRAMVGGNDNRNFNRATALRQMGSTFKPVVYHAALKLGWSPDDPLDNQRNVFPFSTTFYYPRPDHEAPPTVSLSWAGAKSENLASVWLLHHLLDRLDGEGIRSLAESLGLARRPDESEEAYRLRIQKAGVLPTPARVDEALYLQARQEVLAGIERSAHPEDALPLTSLLYGWGFAAERRRVAREGAATRAWKERALDNSWLHLEPMLDRCSTQYDLLARSLEASQPPGRLPDLSVSWDEREVRVACGRRPEGYVPPDRAFFEAWLAGEPQAREPAEGGPTAEDATRAPRPYVLPEGDFRWPFFARRSPRLVGHDDVLVDDRLHMGTLLDVRDAMRRRKLALELAEEPPDLYDPSLLYWHQDFRTLLAMEYVTALAERYGVRTELARVLSMPLGASEITLEEAVSLYEGLATGQGWTFPGVAGHARVPAPEASTLLIAEIRDVDGRVIYRAEPRAEELASREIAHMSTDVLRNVVRHGTGQRALRAVQLGGAAVPLAGKTGTTNDFRNAAFLGVVPVWTGSAFSVDRAFVVGAYVGYDDNRPMRNGNIRLAGASGALPAWIGAAETLARTGRLGEPTGAPLPDGTWPLEVAPGLVRLPVDPEQGLGQVARLELDEEAPSVLVPRRQVLEDLEFRRVRRPPRAAPRTDRHEEPLPRRGIWR